MKTKTLVLILLIVNLKTFCQTNFIPGYVVNKHSDTIHCEIDYWDWKQNPRKIKTNQNDKQIFYSASELNYVHTKEKSYVGVGKNFINYFRTLNDLVQDSTTQFYKDTIFLEQLVSGPKSLYYLYDQNGKEHLFIKNSKSEIEELNNYRYLKLGYNVENVIENETYKTQLYDYLSDCTELSLPILNVKFNKKDILNLFSKYYKIKYQNNKIIRAEKKTLTSLGPLIGMASTSLKFKGVSNKAVAYAKFNHSLYPIIGLHCNIALPYRLYSFSIYNDISIRNYNFNKIESIPTDNNSYVNTIYQTSFKATYFRISNALRLRLFYSKLTFYSNIGITNSLYVKYYNQVHSIKNFYNIHSEDDYQLVPKEGVKRYELGYLIGFGSKYKKLGCELRYEFGNGSIQKTFLTSATHALLIQATYDLF